MSSVCHLLFWSVPIRLSYSKSILYYEFHLCVNKHSTLNYWGDTLQHDRVALTNWLNSSRWLLNKGVGFLNSSTEEAKALWTGWTETTIYNTQFRWYQTLWSRPLQPQRKKRPMWAHNSQDTARPKEYYKQPPSTFLPTALAASQTSYTTKKATPHLPHEAPWCKSGKE